MAPRRAGRCCSQLRRDRSPSSQQRLSGRRVHKAEANRDNAALEGRNRGARPPKTDADQDRAQQSRGRGAISPGSVPSRIAAPYALRPPIVQHYADDAPAEQKIRALAGRSETQARDVFDLDLLLRRRPFPGGSLDSQILSEAADRALQLPFAAFRDQVLPFLEPDAVELYDSEAAWEQMQTFVAQRLEEAQ